MKYLNRGMANKKLRGQREHHVIFKFDTDEQAKDFITKVKEWYYSLEEVGKKIETSLREAAGKRNIENRLKDQTNEQKPNPVKKPVEKEKPKRGRPSKKNIQR